MRPLSLATRRVLSTRPLTPATTTWWTSAPRFAPRSFALRHPAPSRPFTSSLRRFESALSVPGKETSTPQAGPDQPAYELTFTCKPCLHRSSHRVTKQGYHHGTVLISCPHCKARHLISDHLKIFIDHKSTLEDILKRKLEKEGEGGNLFKLLKKGKLGIRQGALVGNEGEEDLEFWEDGSESVRTPATQSPASGSAQ